MSLNKNVNQQSSKSQEETKSNTSIVNKPHQISDPTNNVNSVIIGVCGGIASGKSYLCSKLHEKYKYQAINADKIGHQVLKEPNTKSEIVKIFGNQVLDENTQEIDRRALGKIVFADKSQMVKLNDIMWPIILQNMKTVIQDIICKYDKISTNSNGNNSQKAIIIIVEAAILLEAKWHQLGIFDQIWIPFAPTKIICERLMARNKLNIEQAIIRINSQMTNEQRIECVEHAKESKFIKNYIMINNETDLQAFDGEIDKCVQQILIEKYQTM